MQLLKVTPVCTEEQGEGPICMHKSDPKRGGGGFATVAGTVPGGSRQASWKALHN